MYQQKFYRCIQQFKSIIIYYYFIVENGVLGLAALPWGKIAMDFRDVMGISFKDALVDYTRDKGGGILVGSVKLQCWAWVVIFFVNSLDPTNAILLNTRALSDIFRGMEQDTSYKITSILTGNYVAHELSYSFNSYYLTQKYTNDLEDDIKTFKSITAV